MLDMAPGKDLSYPAVMVGSVIIGVTINGYVERNVFHARISRSLSAMALMNVCDVGSGNDGRQSFIVSVRPESSMESSIDISPNIRSGDPTRCQMPKKTSCIGGDTSSTA